MQSPFAPTKMDAIGDMAMECGLFASVITAAIMSPLSTFWPM